MASLFFRFFSLFLILVLSPLHALETTDRVRLMIDEIDVNKNQDAEYAKRYQKILISQISNLGRFEIITSEGIKTKMAAQAKIDAGFEVSDKDMAQAASLAGASFLIRARLSEVRHYNSRFDKVVMTHVETDLSIRLIDIETITAVSSLSYKLKNDGVETVNIESLLEKTYTDLANKLKFDLVGMMLLRANSSEHKGEWVNLKIGKNAGVLPISHFKLYNNQRLTYINEFGETTEEIVRKPIGDLRIVKIEGSNAWGEMRRRTGAFSSDMSAVEWNLRNIHIDMMAGLSTFGVSFKSNQISSTSMGDANSNYFLQIDGSDTPIAANSRMRLGGNNFSPFFNFQIGWGPGKFVFFGRLNVLLTSPLSAVSLDPGVRLDLIETGVFNLGFDLAGKLGYLGGKVGSLQFNPGYIEDGNHLSKNGGTGLFGRDVPLGSTVQMVNFFWGLSATMRLGFNVSASSRFYLFGGYEWIPDVTPSLILLNQPTIVNQATLPSYSFLSDKARKLIMPDDLKMSRILFGINFSYLY